MSKKVLNLRTHSSEKVPSSGSAQGLPGSTDLSMMARLVSSRACQSRRDEIPSNLCLLQKPQASERATHISPPNCLLWTPSCYLPQPTKGREERRGKSLLCNKNPTVKTQYWVKKECKRQDSSRPGRGSLWGRGCAIPVWGSEGCRVHSTSPLSTQRRHVTTGCLLLVLHPVMKLRLLLSTLGYCPCKGRPRVRAAPWWGPVQSLVLLLQNQLRPFRESRASCYMFPISGHPGKESSLLGSVTGDYMQRGEK